MSGKLHAWKVVYSHAGRPNELIGMVVVARDLARVHALVCSTVGCDHSETYVWEAKIVLGWHHDVVVDNEEQRRWVDDEKPES